MRSEAEKLDDMTLDIRLSLDISPSPTEMGDPRRGRESTGILDVLRSLFPNSQKVVEEVTGVDMVRGLEECGLVSVSVMVEFCRRW